jgi:hypothetical protein
MFLRVVSSRPFPRKPLRRWCKSTSGLFRIGEPAVSARRRFYSSLSPARAHAELFAFSRVGSRQLRRDSRRVSSAPRDSGRSNFQSGEGEDRGRAWSCWNMKRCLIQPRTCSAGSKGSCFLMTGNWDTKTEWRRTGAVGVLAADNPCIVHASCLRVQWDMLHVLSAVGLTETADTRDTYWKCVAQRTLADRVCAVDALLRRTPSGSCRNPCAHPSPQRALVVYLH